MDSQLAAQHKPDERIERNIEGFAGKLGIGVAMLRFKSAEVIVRSNGVRGTAELLVLESAGHISLRLETRD